jgi:hypothetical protein
MLQVSAIAAIIRKNLYQSIQMASMTKEASQHKGIYPVKFVSTSQRHFINQYKDITGKVLKFRRPLSSFDDLPVYIFL